MKKMIAFAVRYPVTILMLVLGIMLLGKISYDRLSVDLMPDLNNPKLYIEIEAGDNPPEEIERQFVEAMESQAIRQSDVTMVSSVVMSGSARITVEYTTNKDMDEAFLDLQKAMSSYTRNEDLTELSISQYDPNTAPIVLLGLSHPAITDMAELRRVADTYIRNELIRHEGVAEVALSGDEVTNLVIETDAYKLNAFGLNVDDIAGRIEQNNQNLTGGRVNEMGIQYIVKGANMLTAESDFENLIVGYRATGSGVAATGTSMAPIYLREVATVKFENAPPENIVRINGTRSMGLSVFKEMQYNTVKAVENVVAQLDVIERALPGYDLQVISNQGTFIEQSIGEVKDTAVLGVILAVVVLFLFLRRVGVTIIVSLAIPISIVATFNLMYFGGLTMNIMTLGGLALGAGMLIDNAIVVIESIFSNKETGLSVEESAIKGTTDVAGAVSASTLTTIVVFLPIVYLHGAAGQLFKDMAWTVAFSLISSLFVAILVIPMLYNYFFGNRKRPMKPVKAVEIKSYGRFLHRVIKARWGVIVGALALLAVGVAVLPMVGTEFMPKADGRSFSINVKMPEGTRIERTDAAVESMERLLHEISRDTAIVVYTHVGPGSGSENAIFEGENTALMKVILSPSSPTTQEAVVAEFLAMTNGIDGVEVTVAQEEGSMASLLGSEGAPVVVEVKGEDLEVLTGLTVQVRERMEGIPELFNIVSSIEDGAPEMAVTIDRAVAGMNNISVSTITSQLRQQLDGYTAGTMTYRGDTRDVVVKLPDVTLEQLGSLIIRSGTQEFQLRELASIEPSVAPKEIFRRNQSRISRVMSNLEKDVSLDKVAQEIRAAVADIELPLNYSITVTGEEEKRQEAMGGLAFALVLSVVLVYMVLASQFESLLHPFTILLTIPLALVGAILLFWITGMNINVMGVIGIVMLAGIAVNNSIILVDRIGQMKQTGMNLTDAIVASGQQRIRPILMTTITTILALLPMAVAGGEGASLRSPMAIAVIGGLVTSTAMSLVVIPCVYYLLDTLKARFKRAS